ncbi:MAG TPA: hypothetical protein VES20_08240 [Bryobacteraceae bacterium]|nr:hypothetical protein [Bryobacteraceae bacterium]
MTPYKFLVNNAPLKPEDVADRDLGFANLQGYTIVNHGREHVWLGLMRFTASPEDLPKLIVYLKAAGQNSTSARTLYRTLESYSRLKRSDAALAASYRRTATGGLVTAVGISESGFRKALPNARRPSSEAFRDGFVSRYRNRLQRDLPEGYDAVLVVAAHTDAEAKSHADTATEELAGLATVTWRSGTKNEGKEHFGYADGISQPQFFAEVEGAPPGAEYEHARPLSALLIAQPGAAPQAHEYGSFMAYIGVEQHLEHFQELIRKATEGGGCTEDEVTCWLMGRSRAGVALMGDHNYFTYSGPPPIKCPVSAHIRKANPRRTEDWPVRILRRGVAYKTDDGKCGILFQSFQADLQAHFERILFSWLLSASFPNAEAGPDPILGSRSTLPVPTGRAAINIPETPLTEIFEGEYFYLPSRPFFSTL